MTYIKNKIEEEARKYAEAYGRNIVPIHNDLSVYYTDCYEAGARSILEKWKDASRWRKVSDELPKYYKPIIARISENEFIIAYYLPHNHRGDAFYYNCEPDIDCSVEYDILEWKPID